MVYPPVRRKNIIIIFAAILQIGEVDRAIKRGFSDNNYNYDLHIIL